MSVTFCYNLPTRKGEEPLFIEGKEEELLGRLQQKLGKTKEELREIISKL